MVKRVRCEALTLHQMQCRHYALEGSQPPRCKRHGGDTQLRHRSTTA